ncbi:MAG TPA: NADH-ubiquinone oxidoreductase-F iron-sulfur binding region domain-containing protein [Tepidisphaeraceae bacterium]|nr:NADH-ubiquinone oxidoreductase-F iron-sulfur binding region domain-containing protein [Tepidisphaeraceae bacterium]
MIIAELNAIQKRYGYIPEKELYELAERINKPVHELHGVASFYPLYRLSPPPRVSVAVCGDAPCHLKGAPALLKKMRELTGADKTVEVKHCSCLGQCDRAPAILLNDHPHSCDPGDSHAPRDAADMAELARRAIAGEDVGHQHFTSAAKGPFRTDPYTTPDEHYSVLKDLLGSAGFEQAVVDKIKAANLRGMGGAGTVAFRKWQTVKDQNSEQKYIVCNADESEVGTIKDRELLKNLPHLLVEAMTIAGVTVGAGQGYVYIRHEYHEQAEIIQREIDRARSMGAMGDDIFGSGRSFNLEVFVSPGGYVQGEETALLEAIEGKRGQPRNKSWDVGLMPGVPAFMGLWGKPTIINNVETYMHVPVILAKGPEWFLSQGKNGAQGLKWIGIGGDVARPGVFEVSMGTTYREAIEIAGGVANGAKLKAVCPSGPSLGFLLPTEVDVPMDFPAFDREGKPANEIAKLGTSVGSAAIIVLAEGRDMVDLALNMTKFYRNESCGKCVPCRVGSQKMVDIITGITEGSARDTDLNEIARLTDTMNMTSICGLGQVVANPISSVLKKWRPEVEAYLRRAVQPRVSETPVQWNEGGQMTGSAAAAAGMGGNR